MEADNRQDVDSGQLGEGWHRCSIRVLKGALCFYSCPALWYEANGTVERVLRHLLPPLRRRRSPRPGTVVAEIVGFLIARLPSSPSLARLPGSRAACPSEPSDRPAAMPFGCLGQFGADLRCLGLPGAAFYVILYCIISYYIHFYIMLYYLYTIILCNIWITWLGSPGVGRRPSAEVGAPMQKHKRHPHLHPSSLLALRGSQSKTH